MSRQSLLESTVNGIQDQIKNNLSGFLAEIRTDTPDGQVTTEMPVNYFFYENAIAYKTPSVFIVADSVDFRLSQGQNHINALIKIYVSIVVEDRNERLLTLKVFRYLDALHKCLDRAHIISTNGKLQNIIKVVRADVSSTQKKQMSSTESPFRKEVMLTLDVEHYESEN